jgi:hypothetical protein
MACGEESDNGRGAIAMDDERAQFAALGEALKEWIKQEASNAHSEQGEAVCLTEVSGSPGEIRSRA